MSLLMNALKKAEQDKKAAAKHLRITPLQDLSLDDVAPTQALGSEDDLAGSVPPLPAPADVNEDMLAIAEDDLSVAADINSEVPEETVSGILPDQTPAPINYTLDATLVDDSTQAEQAFADADSIAEDVGEYEYFGATVSAEQLAKDIGADGPTPVVAQTVFTEISTRSGDQVLQWGAFLILPLVIAVSLSFFVFNYMVPVERSMKSPMVARDIETPFRPVPVFEIPDELVSDSELDGRSFTSEITDIINNETIIEAGQADNKISIDPLVKTQENIEDPTEEHTPALEIVEETSSRLPEKIELDPELVKISRRTSRDKGAESINQAYQEYVAGNYDLARQAYRHVLKDLPESRDALLGLAAISIRSGHMREAYANYLEVLRLFPGDSFAEAALINLKHDGDQIKNESILKTFIQKEPDNSFLHYSLGRLYAEQTRWSEAQQSFFDAYRIEDPNPDYAFNLAVSLDHIGQQQSAIDYYRAALELADQSANGSVITGFDNAVVISRIDALSRSMDRQ